MSAFKSLRVAHEYTQSNPASPDRVFPLLCPVREAEWVPDWKYRLIYSESGVAELGCVFTTPNGAAPSEMENRENPGLREMTWIVVDYDPVAFRIAYVWIDPGRVATELRIQLKAADDGSRSKICFRYTGLSEEGNLEVERYDRRWFDQKMQGWESAINHYLRTGKRVAAAGWE